MKIRLSDRMLALLVVATMLFGILPTTIIANDTSDTTVSYACDDHTGWTDLNGYLSEKNTTTISADGNYYLTGNLELESTLTISGEVTLCLNDYNITYTGTADAKGVIQVNSGAAFNLYGGEKSTGAIVCRNSTNSTTSARGVYVSGTFNMYGGVITEGYHSSGGGVYVTSDGAFNLYGGSIMGNNATDIGGGVYAYGDFNMYGGTISNNTASNGGGGVYLKGTMAMSGGTISNNEANGEGGGVYINDSAAVFTMTGGIIGGEDAGNTAGDGGGGVYIDKGGNFTMDDDAVISYNIADNTESWNGNDGNGGGVYISNGTFTMNGGTIEYNSAQSGTDNDATDDDNGNGGGVYVNYNNATFTMTGGSISNNSAEYKGGGVYTYNEFTMDGGSIYQNTAVNGGGVYVNGDDDAISTFTMNGGSIESNTATAGTGDYSYVTTAGGGGVYIAEYSTFTMNDGTITDNKATDGAGVYVGGNSTSDTGDEGVFNLKGGTITANTARSIYGGGVYLSNDGKMSIGSSDAAILVTGNIGTDSDGTTTNNLYIPSSQTITVSETPADGSKIGIFAANINEVSATEYIDYFTEANASATSMFTADNSGYGVMETFEKKGDNSNTVYSYYVVKSAVILTVNGEDKTGTLSTTTLAGAISKCSQDYSTDTATITLLNDSTATNQISLSPTTTTLDLNGYDVIAPAELYALNLCGEILTITDRVGTGSIDSIYGGELTLDGAVTIGELYLLKGDVITVSRALDGASIGISTSQVPVSGTPVVIAQGTDEYTLTETDLACFALLVDDADGVLRLNTTDNTIEWYVAPTISEEVEVSGDAYDTYNPQLGDDADALLDYFTDEDYDSEQDLKIVLNVAEQDMDSLSDEEQALINDAIEALDDATFGFVLDLSLEKWVGDDMTNITELDDVITITIAIPEEYQADGRTFSVIRVHEGVATVLEDLDDDPTTITFQTNLFSTYAVTYVDAVVDSDDEDDDADVEDDADEDEDEDVTVDGVDTGDSNTALPIALTLLALAGMIVLMKKKALVK